MNKTSVRFSSVWDALADTVEEAANLKVRAELMRMIASLIQESGRTQAAAAKRCGITQPRINESSILSWIFCCPPALSTEDAPPLPLPRLLCQLWRCGTDAVTYRAICSGHDRLIGHRV